MRVAWLADKPDYVGGAELTQAEFAASAPKGVEVIRVDPGGVELLHHFDAVCVFNCVTYPADTIKQLQGKRVVRYYNDLLPHGDPTLRTWLLEHATSVFCSPLHREKFPWPVNPERESLLIPPPLDLKRFRKAARDAATDRTGAVSIAAWMNPGKAPHLPAEWANGTGIDFFGGGPYAPDGSTPVKYDAMPSLLATYDTFVFLPTAVEPFGRLVAEADAAGCKIVTNNLVGARYWLEHDRDALETAAEDFWKLVVE